jgi:hypothetical protein
MGCATSIIVLLAWLAEAAAAVRPQTLSIVGKTNVSTNWHSLGTNFAKAVAQLESSGYFAGIPPGGFADPCFSTPASSLREGVAGQKAKKALTLTRGHVEQRQVDGGSTDDATSVTTPSVASSEASSSKSSGASSAVTSGAPTPVTFMAVGDSIVQGREGDWTWRYRLWEWLRSEQQTVNWVGAYNGTRAPDKNPGPATAAS